MGNKDLTFSDWLKDFNELGKTEWITVFSLSGSISDNEQIAYFSAIISNAKVKNVLKKYEWDLRLDGGRPEYITYFRKGKSVTKYYRFSEKGIEPLVYWRTFKGKKESYLEVAEEFRLYFDLFEKNLSDESKVFIYTNDDGEEDEVVRIEKNKVLVKLKYIKEYSAAKKAHLAIYFEIMRFSKQTLEELGQTKVDEVKKGVDYIYSLCIRNLSIGDYKSQGWLLGKKLIAGQKDFKPTLWEFKEDKRFEEFIIGVDENGKEILASCNTDYQSKPGFLTPVFFRREVLKKYYESPDIFSVEDGYLRCEGFWGLRIMNNHRDHVVVWLGDLKNLPYKEQAHWRAFNITPGDRKIAYADFTRNIEGEFSEPEHPELYFKYKFHIFQEAWYKKFGWHLFHPLSDEDNYHMKSLHVPTTNDQKEFDDQVASIAKILIDSLNGKDLAEGITIEKENPGSIDKLEAFLNSQGLSAPDMITFLRNLQSLRSTGVAHRKGKNYEKVKKFFDIGKKDLSTIFEDILIKCIWILNTLENNFLK
ncbi:hypothetical protein [Caldisericum sp.]|uniref:hypothetical protein n=1 Tax=Caldisericum sp. TaxID=2499687 RepID=UPI003D09DD91